MTRDALTIGKRDRRDVFAKLDNKIFDARFDERDIPILPAVAGSSRSSSPGEKHRRARTGPIKAGGIQFTGNLKVVDFIDGGQSRPAVSGMHSYAHS